MSTTEYRQPTHREELERVLLSGASAQIAHAPENAAAIAKGIKTVLDELAPKMASGIVIPPIGSPSAGTTLTPFASRIGRGLDVQARDTQAAAALASNSQRCQDTLNLPVIDQGHDFQERCIQNHSDERTTKTGMDLAAHDVVTGLALRGLKEVDSLEREAQAKALPPHQQRVLDEKHELDERLSKLDAFILDNPLFTKLPPNEQERLARQSKAMAVYSGILDERIACF